MLNLIKKNKEIINYIIVGGFTTVVSILSYAIFRIIFNYEISTILSWICAVSFAYITNKLFVFESKNTNVKKEFISFIASRLVTLLVEFAFMVTFVDLLKINDMISKIAVQFVIIVLNYILSKFFVFKKQTN